MSQDSFAHSLPRLQRFLELFDDIGLIAPLRQFDDSSVRAIDSGASRRLRWWAHPHIRLSASPRIQLQKVRRAVGRTPRRLRSFEITDKTPVPKSNRLTSSDE